VCFTQVVICTGCQAEPGSALQKAATGTHLWFLPGAGDTVIFSSSPIPGNENNLRRLKSDLKKRGVAVVDNSGTRLTHVTGHPHRDELREMYELVRPRYVIPVHGENSHQSAHAQVAESCGAIATALPKNGEVYTVSADTGVRRLLALEPTCGVWSGTNLVRFTRCVVSSFIADLDGHVAARCKAVVGDSGRGRQCARLVLTTCVASA
jgi:hypothetical protein